MGIADVVRVACNTSTGTQDITGSLGGLTPKAALFIATNCTSDGVAADHAVLGWGGATGASNRWAFCSSSEHNLATSQTARDFVSDECVLILAGAGTVDGEADFSAWITNGVRINWGDAPAGAYLLTVWLFAGSDLSVHAAVQALSLTTDTTADITAPGFEPDLVFIGSMGADADTPANHYHLCAGVGANLATDYQGSVVFVDRDNRGTSDVAMIVSDSYCARNTFPTGGAGSALEIGAYDSSGFSFTARLGNWTTDVAYLAISFGGAVGHWAGSVDSPTATGDDAQTGPGFTPQAVLGLMSWGQAYDTRYTDGDGGGQGFSAFTSSNEYSNAANVEDAETTTDTQTLSDDTAINFPLDDGTAGFVASHSSMDANGWTLNFSTVDSTTRKWVFIAIEEDVAGDPTISVSDSVSVAEAVTVSIQDPDVSVSDSVSVAESVDTDIVVDVNVSDAVGVAEAVEVEAVVDVNVSDSVSVAESVELAVQDPDVAVSDAVGVAESVEAAIEAIAPLTVSVNEAVSVAEAVTTEIIVEVAVSDNVALSDTPEVEIVVAINVGDAVGVAEAVTTEIVVEVAVSDAAGIAENVEASISDTEIDVSEAVGVAESVDVTIVAAGTSTISVNEAIGVAEAVTVDYLAEIDVSEAVGVAESVNASIVEAGTLTLAVSETVGVAEAVTAEYLAEIDVSDAVAVAENTSLAIVTPGIEINVSEMVGVAEAVTISPLLVILAVSEAISVAESSNVSIPVPSVGFSDRNAINVLFRDKRAQVPFRDKRAKGY